MNDHTHVDDPQVAAVLAAATAPAEAPLPGEAEALTAFRSVHHPRRRIRMSRTSENAKLVAAAIFGGVVVISGAAAAATGTLPVGSSHPHPTHPVNTHAPDANDDSQDGADSTDSTDTNSPTENPNDNKGAEISKLAHSLTGGHKGQTICIVASQGHCHAAQTDTTTHGKSDATHGKSDATHGKSDATHGKPDTTTHGQSGVTHGQSGVTHGQSGQHGPSSTS